MTWKDISLGKFQQIERINHADLPDIDKVLHTACIVFDKTEFEINNDEPGKVLSLIGEMQGVFATSINAKAERKIGKYVINYDISKISFGQYIEIAFFFANGGDNIHYVLATMSERWLRKGVHEDHPKKADYFLGQPVASTTGAFKKIQERFVQFNNRYSYLFGVDPEVSGSVQGDDFNKRHGWIYSATQVAAHERITLEEAFELNIVRAFNDLVYLKAKGKYEMEQIRKSNKPVA